MSCLSEAVASEQTTESILGRVVDDIELRTVPEMHLPRPTMNHGSIIETIDGSRNMPLKGIIAGSILLIALQGRGSMERHFGS